jgi:hypothetical protein
LIIDQKGDNLMTPIFAKYLKIFSLLLVPTFVMGSSLKLLAEKPHSAKFSNIVGANAMDVRRNNGQVTPVSEQTILRTLDRLNIPYLQGNIFASLTFFNQANQPMGLRVQASAKNKSRTAYYFPCLVTTEDALIIEWTNPASRVRGCERGVKIKSGKGQNALYQNHPPTIIASLRGIISQSTIEQWQACTVTDDRGNSWLGLTNRYRQNPCQKPLQECQQNQGQNCTESGFDSWLESDPEITAKISCDNSNDWFGDPQELMIQGTGKTLESQITQQWEQIRNGNGTNCDLQILGSDDTIVKPTPEPINRVQVNNKNPCLDFFIYEGSVNIQSAKNLDGSSYNKGQEYEYCAETRSETQSTFNPQDESIDMQVFLAKDRGYEFCNREQDAGGQEIKTRTIQMTATQGKIRINYEMYGIPDQLKLIYEGKEILNTGLISGNGQLSVPFSGKSGQVTVQMIGNQENSGTEWTYTLFCPQ